MGLGGRLDHKCPLGKIDGTGNLLEPKKNLGFNQAHAKRQLRT